MIEPIGSAQPGHQSSVRRCNLGWMGGAVYSISCSLLSWLDYIMVSFCSPPLDLTRRIPIGHFVSSWDQVRTRFLHVLINLASIPSFKPHSTQITEINGKPREQSWRSRPCKAAWSKVPVRVVTGRPSPSLSTVTVIPPAHSDQLSSNSPGTLIWQVAGRSRVSFCLISLINCLLRLYQNRKAVLVSYPESVIQGVKIQILSSHSFWRQYRQVQPGCAIINPTHRRRLRP